MSETKRAKSGVRALSEEISRLAEQYDPKREADITMVRALTQGLLFGGIMKARSDGIIKIDDIELNTDEAGDYEHHFVVVTESGIRLRVTVEPE